MRLYRVSFVAGLAVGFVAGTRAGRERYDQMVKAAKSFAENPTVQQAAGAIQAQATQLVSTTAHKVGGQLHDRVPQMAQSAVHSVGDHISGMRQKNGSRQAAAGGGTQAGDGHPFGQASSKLRSGD